MFNILKPRHKARSVQIFTREGIPNVTILGLPHSYWNDTYHLLLTMPWPGFLGLTACFYLVTNLIFAALYLSLPDGIANAESGSFIDMFSFSVQTMATIGYGAMYPKSPIAHALVTLEVWIGLLGIAMVTSLMFTRFARPTARIMFSRYAVIVPYEGVPTLMFRAANQRANQILEAQVSVAILRLETTTDGHTMRRFYDLKLARSRSPVFALTWTVMHTIDESSPLWGMSVESLVNDNDLTIIVTMTGIDETLSQTIHARHAYLARDILWNQRFVDMVLPLPGGRRAIDYHRFHEVVPW
ncbi:MAG: ion channel [Cyanobacteria bacterium]|nr:ion channel [Cyanobacteriota bacterium]MDW8200190.1 ion channel [Cyanobacteriota bacterium SKYGB_h_bin112]